MNQRGLNQEGEADPIHRNCSFEEHRRRERMEEERMENEEVMKRQEEKQQQQQQQSGISGVDTVDIRSLSALDKHRYLRRLVPDICRQWSPELYQLGVRTGGMVSPLRRNLFFTLYALNGEIGHIKDATTSPSTGSIRIEWWKSGIRAALRGDQCPRSPVLIALAIINQTIRDHNAKLSPSDTPYRELKFSDFRELLRWREMDLHWRQPATYDTMEKYAEGVYSHLLYTQLKLAYTEALAHGGKKTVLSQWIPWLSSSLSSSDSTMTSDAAAAAAAGGGGGGGGSSDSSSNGKSAARVRMEMEMETDHIASHIGKSFGLVQMLRGVPFHARSGTTYLPADLCAQSGVTEEMIYRQVRAVAQQQQQQQQQQKRKNGDQPLVDHYQYEVDPNELHRISEVVYQVADYANAHLRHARQLSLEKVPSTAIPLFHMSAMCDVFLSRLQKCNFNILDPSLSPDALRMPYLFELTKRSPWWSSKNKF